MVTYSKGPESRTKYAAHQSRSSQSAAVSNDGIQMVYGVLSCSAVPHRLMLMYESFKPTVIICLMSLSPCKFFEVCWLEPSCMWFSSHSILDDSQMVNSGMELSLIVQVNDPSPWCVG